MINISTTHFVSVDQELNTAGFSLETCRSMIALMDVSFTWRASEPHNLLALHCPLEPLSRPALGPLL